MLFRSDPLIPGLAPISKCDVAILAVAHEAIDKEALKNSAPYIFDCTGTLPEVHGL